MWHYRETLPKVASKQDAFAAEWEVVCMHEVSEQAVKAVKLELVGHGAFVPDDSDASLIAFASFPEGRM